MNPAQTIMNNIDKKTMFSVMAGMALLGVVTFVTVKTGIKPLVKAAKVVKP